MLLWQYALLRFALLFLLLSSPYPHIFSPHALGWSTVSLPSRRFVCARILFCNVLHWCIIPPVTPIAWFRRPCPPLFSPAHSSLRVRLLLRRRWTAFFMPIPFLILSVFPSSHLRLAIPWSPRWWWLFICLRPGPIFPQGTRRGAHYISFLCRLHFATTSIVSKHTMILWRLCLLLVLY